MRAERYFADGCASEDVPESFDLTKWLRRADVEKGIGGFVADVLLSDASGVGKLLVEIEVSHACEPEKIESGLSILEVRVTAEDDVVQLLNGIEIDTYKARGFNLSELKERKEECFRDCPLKEMIFVIYKSGKMSTFERSRLELVTLLSSPAVRHWEVLSRRTRSIRPAVRLETAVEDAVYKKGIEARSCFLCRYGAVSRNMMRAPVVCFRDRGRTHYEGLNAAIGCIQYSPFGSHEEFLETRRRQKQSEARRPDGGLDDDFQDEDGVIED